MQRSKVCVVTGCPWIESCDDAHPQQHRCWPKGENPYMQIEDNEGLCMVTGHPWQQSCEISFNSELHHCDPVRGAIFQHAFQELFWAGNGGAPGMCRFPSGWHPSDSGADSSEAVARQRWQYMSSQ
jgi:hypothetical protein